MSRAKNADSINEEVRVRWTGEARYDHSEASWAINSARIFAVNELDRGHGIRRSVVYTLGPIDSGKHAYIYWTKARAVVVRIHEEPSR